MQFLKFKLYNKFINESSNEKIQTQVKEKLDMFSISLGSFKFGDKSGYYFYTLVENIGTGISKFLN